MISRVEGEGSWDEVGLTVEDGQEGSLPEVGLLGRAASHGLVVGVQVGVVVDLQRLRVEGGGDLETSALTLTARATMKALQTHLGPDGILNRRAGVHGGELSSHARKTERVSSKHEVLV